VEQPRIIVDRQGHRLPSVCGRVGHADRVRASRQKRSSSLDRYAKHNANIVLVVSGSLEAQRTKKFIEILYDLLIKPIELRSFALLKFGVRSEGLK